MNEAKKGRSISYRWTTYFRLFAISLIYDRYRIWNPWMADLEALELYDFFLSGYASNLCNISVLFFERSTRVFETAMKTESALFSSLSSSFGHNLHRGTFLHQAILLFRVMRVWVEKMSQDNSHNSRPDQILRNQYHRLATLKNICLFKFGGSIAIRRRSEYIKRIVKIGGYLRLHWLNGIFVAENK